MNTSNYLYYLHDEEFHGFLAYDDTQDKPRPAILVAHDWSGCNEFAQDKALKLAKMGYVGFALDLYGLGRKGTTTDEKEALMQPLANDRRLVRTRMRAAFDALIAMPEVDSARVAAIGYCFGGMCVLDLARSGAELSGVVSFHGLLNKPTELASHPISAKILALHGYDDPMVQQEQVNLFCQEMTEAQVDWQLHSYGQTKHAFTNPAANDPTLGTIYNQVAERRSWLAMTNFLQEILGSVDNSH